MKITTAAIALMGLATAKAQLIPPPDLATGLPATAITHRSSPLITTQVLPPMVLPPVIGTPPKPSTYHTVSPHKATGGAAVPAVSKAVVMPITTDTIAVTGFPSTMLTRVTEEHKHKHTHTHTHTSKSHETGKTNSASVQTKTKAA